MPRYYFDLLDDYLLPDDEGQEMADLDAAKDHAVTILTEVASDILPRDGPAKYMRVSVRDEPGAVLLTAELEFRIRSGS